MERGFEERFRQEINTSFVKDPEKAKYAIEYNWKMYLNYFLSYFLPRQPKGKLLDVGCGTGLVLKELLGKELELYGIDFSEKAIEYAKNQKLNIAFKYASVYQLPFESSMFDTVICLGVFQSVENPAAALKEIIRVIKPGGNIVIRTLNTLSLSAAKAKRNNPNFRFYNPFMFKKEIKQAGFTKVRLKGIYFFPRPFEWLNVIVMQMGFYNILNIFFPLSVFWAHSFYIDAVKND